MTKYRCSSPYKEAGLDAAEIVGAKESKKSRKAKAKIGILPTGNFYGKHDHIDRSAEFGVSAKNSAKDRWK